MTWRDLAAAWTGFETRRPLAWRTGVFGLLGGAVAMVLSELGALPQLPAAGRAPILAVLALLAVFVGRRLLWNDGERRLRTLWRLVGFNALVVGLSIAGDKAGLPLDRGALASGDSGTMLAATLALLVVLTLACLLAVRLLDRRPVRELGIVPGPGFWGDLGFGLGLGALLMALIFGFELALGWIEVVDVARPGLGAASFAAGFLNMTLLFLAVGFYEELANRGYLLRALAQGFVCRRIPPAAALAAATLLSSLVFGLGHLGNPHSTWVSTFNIVLAGIMLALPYLLTGRLAASIGLHVTWNLFQGSVFGFPVSGLDAPATLLVIEQRGPEAWTGGAFGPEAGLVGLIAMGLGSALIVWRERRARGRAAVDVRLVTGAGLEGEPSILPAQALEA
jgi:hypothetical protein